MRACTLLPLLLLAYLAHAQEPPVADFGFEDGLEGWGVWYSDDPNADITRYAYTVDEQVAHGGERSLRIDAPDANGQVFVYHTVPVEPGQRYAIAYWYRTGDDLDMSGFSVRGNVRPVDPKAAGWVMQGLQPLPVKRDREGDWRYLEGYVLVPADAKPDMQLGLYLQRVAGTLWIDDITVTTLDPEANRLADMWVYDPHRVELGSAPLVKFRDLKEANDPILERAQRYNELLVDSAFVQENLRRLARLSAWTAAPARAPLDQAATLDDALAELYRAYGEAYLDRDDAAKAAAFDQQAEALAEVIAQQAAAARQALDQAVAARREAAAWAPPATLPAAGATPAISGDGRVNHLIFGNRSMSEFAFMETPLRFDSFHSTTAGGPNSSAPGQYDWSPYLDEWKTIQANSGAATSGLLLFAALHDGIVTPGWLSERIAADPELLHVLNPPGELRDRGNRKQLNWWHPDVRAYAAELAGDMGRTFADRDEFLFYLFQWESWGTEVGGSEHPLREVGYGAHATADFHRWLADKYGSIDALNARWRTDFADFAAIAPPPDRYIEERRHTGPLAAEWEAWREDSYSDWCKLIYDAWKAADPDKPVIAGHSNLFRRFSMPDVFDTCDILSWHNSGTDFMPITMYAHSLSRYNGNKPLAQYENFWGVQEDHDRMHDERARRHGAHEHVFRLTMWDRFLQVWWYSYTAATYLTHYDGNYFDPSYALTTLRYRTAALPVSFEKARGVQAALLESEIVPSRVLVVAPTASMRNSYPYNAPQVEVRNLFWRLFPHNVLFECVPEEYLLDGRTSLADFDVVILPYASYLPEPLQDALTGWLAGGPRLLLATGAPGVYDELGLPSGKLLSAAFGDRPFTVEHPAENAWAIATPGAEGDMVRGRVGDSEVLVTLKPFADIARDEATWQPLLAGLLARGTRPAWDDADAFEVVVRAAGDTRYLCVLNPSADDPAESTVHVKGTFDSVTDLDIPGGYAVPAKVEGGVTSFPLRLEPGEWTVVRLGE